jgi:hypothetical protein
MKARIHFDGFSSSDDGAGFLVSSGFPSRSHIAAWIAPFPMAFDRSSYHIVRASDVSSRDGIGVEISRGGKLVCEIFRDDTDRTRTVWLADQVVPLEELEGFIQIFKDEIDWDFIDCEES